MKESTPKLSFEGVSTGLAWAAAIVLLLSGVCAASAQIVPETSGKTSAAYSRAAVVQTGSRNRLICGGCERSDNDDFGRRIDATEAISRQRPQIR